MRSMLITFLLCLLLPASAAAQEATIFRLPDGRLVGFVNFDGQTLVLQSVTITELLVPEEPDPPQPPDPPVSAPSWAMIVYESETAGQPLEHLIQSIRDNRQLSQLVPVIADKDLKDERRQPDPQVQAALELIDQLDGEPAGSAGDSLPWLIGFKNGAPTVGAELPDSVAGIIELLTEWRLMP